MSDKLTLLLIAGQQIARVDVTAGKRPRVVKTWTRERAPAEAAAAQVDAALRLGPTKSGTVWVLSADAWNGIVELAPDMTGMLEGEELTQSVVLEAETYSGISAFESRLGLCELPAAPSGERRWWVVQVPSADYGDMARTVKQFGAKWGGVGHPAAIGPLAADHSSDHSAGPWRTVQAFGESTVALAGVGDLLRDTFSGGDLSSSRTQTQLAEWLGAESLGGRAASEGFVTWLAERPIPDELAGESDQQLVIADESTLQQWAIATARGIRAAQREEGHAPPLVAAPKQPMSSTVATCIACGVAAVLGLACYGVYGAFDRQLEELNAEVERLEKQKSELGAVKKQVQEREKRAKSLADELAKAQRDAADLTLRITQAEQVRQFQQSRWLSLVDALAEACSDSCWVRAIDSDAKSATIEGLAIRNGDVMQLTALLEQDAGRHGWIVHPARSEPDETGLVAFSITLDTTDGSSEPARGEIGFTADATKAETR